MKNTESQKFSWTQHIDSWKQSTLSQNAYCRSHNLSASQFSYWKHKLQGDHNGLPPIASAFVPVNVEVPPSNEKRSSSLVLTLPNGCALSGWTKDDLPFAKQLIEALQ